MPKRPEVERWLERYENPMKPVLMRMREALLAADGRLDECIKWQAPTFVYKGNLASFFPKSKQHASLMFHTGAKIPGKHPRLVGGGGTSRMMKLGNVAEVSAAKADITRVVKAWCDWRDASGGSAAKADGAAKRAAKAPARKPAKRSAARKPASGAAKKSGVKRTPARSR